MTLLARLGDPLPERYYLGLDVGYKEHVAVVTSLPTFVQGGDRWKRSPALAFPTTRAGFEKLQGYLDRFSPDPQKFFGVCEPTGGHYGATVFQYLLDRHYPMWWIENVLTRRMRERIFGNVPKTDPMDARTMTRICYLYEAVGEEFSLRPLHLAQRDDAELLALCRDDWRLTRMVGRVRSQFGQLMAVVFPELKEFFPDTVSSVAPVSVIHAYPSPAELAVAPTEDVAAVLWKVSAYHHAKRAAELQALARTSVGLLPDPGRAWRITWQTDFLLTNFRALHQLERQIKALVRHHPNARWLADLPYSGPATLGVILSVTGDVKRFGNYRQFVAYTGYFAGLEKSQTIDHTRMSRRGNRQLKRALFQIVAPLVWFDPGDNPYKQLYARKKAEGRAWYAAMPFACAALARHIFHCLKSQQPYDVRQAFGGAAPQPGKTLAAGDRQAELDERFQVMEAHLDRQYA